MTIPSEKTLHVGLIYWDPFTPGGVQSQVAGRIEHLGCPEGPVRYTLFSKRPPPANSCWPHVRTIVFSGWDKISIAISEYTAGRDLARKLTRIQRHDPFDLLDVHGPDVSTWARQNNVPYIAVCHSLRFFSQADHGHRWEVAQYYNWVVKRQFLSAFRVIAVGNVLRDELCRFGIPHERVIVQPAAIHSYPPAQPTTATGDKPLEYRILFVGRPAREKGLDILLEGLKILRTRNQCPRFRLTVLGDFPKSDPMRELCRYEGIPVSFLGSRPNAEVRQFMADTDVLVVPSRYESCGLVAIEGMAAGALVLASRIGGLQDSITEGQTGLFFEPENAVSLADQLLRIANCSDEYASLRNAAKIAAERLSWPAVAPKLLEIYNEAWGSI